MLIVTTDNRIQIAPSFRRNQHLRRVLCDLYGHTWWRKQFARRDEAYEATETAAHQYLEERHGNSTRLRDADAHPEAKVTGQQHASACHCGDQEL